MAICTICTHEMIDHVSCIHDPVLTRSGVYEPIRYGRERRMPIGRSAQPCGDCGAPPGGYHHRGCDLEECPCCGRQLISCGCSDSEDDEALNDAFDAGRIDIRDHIDSSSSIGARIWDDDIALGNDAAVALLFTAIAAASDEHDRQRLRDLLGSVRDGDPLRVRVVLDANDLRYESAMSSPVRREVAALARSVGSFEALEHLDTTTPLPTEEAFHWDGIADDVHDAVSRVVDLVDGCAQALLDNEFRTACRRLLARAAVIEPSVFRRDDDPAKVAAAICWLVAQANRLLGKYQPVQARAFWAHFGLRNASTSLADRLLRAAAIPIEPNGYGYRYEDGYAGRDRELYSAEYLIVARRRRIAAERDALRLRLAC